VVNTVSGLSCTNTMEYNSKLVYGIYAATWMQGIMAFTPADSATLFNIAIQDPVDGGTAVLSARIMLELDIDFYSGSSQRIGHSDESSEAQTQSDMKLYPNPTNENVVLECNIEEGQNAQVEIFDLSGNRVLSQQLAPQQAVYNINVAALPGGVFLLRVFVDGEATEAQRLVIVK